MPRIVRCGLIQAKNVLGPEAGLPAIKKAMLKKHVELIAEAGRKKVRALCLQELFYGPYFCAEQETRWYHLTERVPDGPTVTLMQKLAKKHRMVIVVPIYEEEQAGVYYNTAAVIDADGSYLGKFRKIHIPQVLPGHVLHQLGGRPVRDLLGVGVVVRVLHLAEVGPVEEFLQAHHLRAG